jgi:hypothetical protein
MPRNGRAAVPAGDDSVEILADWGTEMVEVFAKLSETALASGTVVGERIGLAMTALADPDAVDHAEFTLMTTEKIEGFTDAFSAVMDGLWQVGHDALDVMAGQAESFGRAAAAVGTAHTPFDVFAAQQRWFSEVVTSTGRHGIRVANGLGSLPASALEPVHSRVTDNVRRLGRGKGRAIAGAAD